MSTTTEDQNGPVVPDLEAPPAYTADHASDERTPLLQGASPSAPTATANDSETSSRSSSQRLLYLDHVRGLLMILQSIDHSRLFLSRIEIAHEEWWNMPDYKGSVYHWLVRFVTSVCEPGFMMTMGMSVLLFTMSRFRLGWGWTAILKHFWVRGLVLVIVNCVLIETWGFVSAVLFALGVNMFLSACIVLMEHYTTERISLRLQQRQPPVRDPFETAVTFSVACYVLAATIITCLASWYTPSPDHAQNGHHYSWLYRLWFLPYPAVFDAEGGWFFYSMNPPIPWLGMVLWGVALQRIISVFRLAKRTVGVLHAACAILMFIIFIPVRLNGGFGNINIGELHPPPRESFINFFNLTKYPPSVAYTTCTLGLVHALCALFVAAECTLKNTVWVSARNPLAVFGRSAFFFYVIHFYTYRLFRFLCLQLGLIRLPPPSSRPWGSDPSGNLPDGMYWTAWVAGLVMLYVMCERYARFKSSTAPESLWRLF